MDHFQMSSGSFVLRDPIMLLAFEGWNDAGESATSAIKHLLAIWQHEVIAISESEEFYDFQVNRPLVKIDAHIVREIHWPTTTVYAVKATDFDRDFLIVKGIEPSMRWPTFVSEILDIADDYEVNLVVTCGAMLADVPHTRPITVSGTGAHPDVAKKLGVEISRYEGPTGILGVILDACNKRGIDAMSLWAAIPHYVSQPPCHKASLALIHALEDFLDISINQGDLPDLALAWEESVNRMAQEDPEIAEYVKTLERSRDTSELPEVTGDSIAREFERYLRRQGDQTN